jgi:hypothetical protein
MGGTCRGNGEVRNEHEILAGKLEEKRPRVRLVRRLKDSIKVNLKEIASEDMDWIHVAQDKVQWRTVVNTVMNFRFP